MFTDCKKFMPSRRQTLHFALAGLLASKMAWAQTPAIVVLGDSLSAEYGLPSGTGWVALLEKKLRQQAWDVPVVNASISGDTSSGGRSRLPALLQKHQPGIVIIELGANDALRGASLQALRDNLSAMIELAQDKGAQVLLLGMQIPPNFGPRYAKDFANIYQDLAKKHKTARVPFLLSGVADSANAHDFFQDDGIHPTAEAQAILLDNVWPELKGLLP